MKVPVRMYKMSGGGQYNVPEEGDVVAWLKHEGDYVNKDEGLCELETDKATVTIVAPISGILVDIAYSSEHRKPWIRGEAILPFGDPIFYDPPFCFIETDEAVCREKLSMISPSISVSKKQKPKISAVAMRLMQELGISVEEMIASYPDILVFNDIHVQNLYAERNLPTQSQDVLTSTDNFSQKEFIRAVPLARTIAHEKKIDLAGICGTGPEGLILAHDVEKKVGVEEVHGKQLVMETSEEPVLLSMPRLWRTIAANMEAASRMPTADIRVDGRRFNIRKLTEFYRANRQSYKLGLWFPLMVAYARVLSREQFILFNSYWHEEVDIAGKITPYIATRRYVHMGIAYDRGDPPVVDWNNKTIRGERLRILTVRNVQRMSLTGITSEVARLFEAALQKRFSLQDTSGYTAIFNNIGVLGHHSGRAILTQGIASELNMGSVDLESGEAVVQLVLDHRLIDGAMTTPFFRALYKELTQCVLPELEALFLEKK